MSCDDVETPSRLLLQLARCNASSDALLDSMRRTFAPRYDRSELILQLSTRYLLVGTCDSRFAGVARFLPTKVIYAFEHPQHRQVEMHMAYKDMLSVRTHEAGPNSRYGGELRFRIARPLAYFSREYDPENAAHDLRIGFETRADHAKFCETVLPKITDMAGR